MWFLYILLGLLAVITAILLLPVKVIVKNDENNELILRYKLLFKTFGENPNPDDPITKTLKKAGGVERLETATIKKNIRKDGLQKTVSDSYEALVALLKELVFLLRRGTVTRLKIKILCADDSPDQTAIHYGICIAATHTLLAALDSFLRIRKRGCDIDIRSDFSGKDPVFRYHLIIAVPFYRVLASFWKVAWAEAKRMGAAQDSEK